MILILTREEDASASLVERYLKQKGASWLRFDPGDFPSHGLLSCKYNRCDLIEQTLYYNKKTFDLGSLTSIWYRRPRQPVAHRNLHDGQLEKWVEDEARIFVQGLWLSLDCFWVSEPRRIYDAEKKPFHLKVAARLGFPIPKTLMTNNPDQFLDFYEECNGDVISKPVLYGNVSYGIDLYQVYTNRIRPKDLGFLHSICYAPVIFQEYIPKYPDTDLLRLVVHI